MRATLLKFTALLIVTFSFGCLCAGAQTIPPNNGQPIDSGSNPFGSYQLNDFDSVNMYTLQPAIKIPLLSYPQRGSHLKYDISASWGSVYTVLLTGDGTAYETDIRGGDWSFGYSFMPFYFEAGSGNTVNAPGAGIVDNYGAVHPASATSATSPLGGLEFVTTDGTGLVVGPISSNPENNQGFINSATPDGVVIRSNLWTSPVIPFWGPGTAVATDVDGNTISTTVGSGGDISTVDSIGRHVLMPFATGNSNTGFSNCHTGLQVSSAIQWTVPVPVSQSAPNGVGYLTFCYATVTTSSSWAVGSSGPQLVSISLPNGTFWQFDYDSNQGDDNDHFGDLIAITTPEGGKIVYTWITAAPVGATIQPVQQSTIRQLASRTVYATPTSAPQIWTYQQNNVWGNVNSSTVTDPQGNDTVYQFDQCGGMTNALETKRTIYSGPASGTPLMIINKQYAFDPIPGYNSGPCNVSYPRLQQQSVTLDTGQMSSTTYVYDDSAFPLRAGGSVGVGQITQEKDYDYGSGQPGAVLRETDTSYYWQQNHQYANAGLFQLPASQTISDANGMAAQTLYTYDDQGSPQGTYGHLTTVKRWLNQPSSPSTGGYVTSTTSYNTQGMPITKTDANGNTTTLTYDSTGLYPSQMTGPNTGSQSVSHNNWYSYDPAYGNLLSHTDENGTSAGDPNHTTVYSYDIMGRLLNETFPPTNQGRPSISISYGDYFCPPPIDERVLPANGRDSSACTAYHVVTQTSLDSGRMLASLATLDGFGRTTNATVPAYGSTNLSTSTTYDYQGRVQSVSGPTQNSSYQYDALGRPLIDTELTGTKQWSYQGNITTFTDAVGGQSQQWFDGLGRLDKVVELGTPADPRNLQTTYSYDALNNLTSVNQIGLPGTVPNGFVSTEASKQRTFTYDSLSRLITSTNPETGTICYGVSNNSGGSGGGGAYFLPVPIPIHPTPPSSSSCPNGYDANGNLVAKTDANNVTTSYRYDELNRLTRKTSSDGSLDNVFSYDTATSLWGGTPFSCTNGIGRLCQTYHRGSSGTAYNYDAMGRTVSTLYASDVNGTGYVPGMAATYDLAGDPISLTYPDGLQVAQTYDNYGRLASVSSGTTTYIGGIGYTDAGQPQSFVLGNSPSFTGITQNNLYDNALQLCRTMVSTPLLAFNPSGGNLLDRELFYNPISIYPSNCNSSATNGNIYAIVDNLNVGWTQSFTYDGLNRLTSAFRSDGGYNHTYNYDSFGNLAVQDNVNSNPVWGVDPATNQLLRNPVAGVTDSYGHPLNFYTYDNAGNMLNSGSFPVGHTYAYNALSQITAVDGGNTASYDYNGNDERAVKHTSTGWTQYVYFNGEPMSEQTSVGTWTDYIYANGQKIAKVNSQSAVFNVQGYRDGSDTSCGVEGPLNGASPGIIGLVIATGDQLVFDLQQNIPMYGGLGLIFTNGDGSGDAVDSNDTRQPLYFDGEADGMWHHMVGSLARHVGETVAYPLFGTHDWAPLGNFSMSMANAAVVHSNGSITPIYTGQSGVSVSAFTGYTCGGQGMTNGTVLTPLSDPTMNTSYFVNDHLGTAQMQISGGGLPIWQGQFTPFGLELPDGNTDMSYKFTGKERDSETGLDNFGARFYSSSMSRWISPDPINLTNARLMNPSNTLNKYAYGANNPLKYIDSDGKDITIFYQAPGIFDFGHIAIAALNQDTGAAAYLNFGPANEGYSLSDITGTPGSFFDSSTLAGMSSLTIQTNPEDAQAVIDAINKIENGSPPDYTVLGSNCTTLVEDALREIGMDFHDTSPTQFWHDVFVKYSPSMQSNPFQIFNIPHDPGREYGDPRNLGMDYGQLLFQILTYLDIPEEGDDGVVTTSQGDAFPRQTPQ